MDIEGPHREGKSEEVGSYQGELGFEGETKANQIAGEARSAINQLEGFKSIANDLGFSEKIQDQVEELIESMRRELRCGSLLNSKVISDYMEANIESGDDMVRFLRKRVREDIGYNKNSGQG